MRQKAIYIILLPVILVFFNFCSLKKGVKTTPEEIPESQQEISDEIQPADISKEVSQERIDAMKEKLKVVPVGNVFQTGIASWYGGKFQGRRTANGEVYDMYKLTAAHKSLPFNSIVEVENLDNGKRVRVRINDRGPFVKDRIIDLSYKAAQRIDSHADGIAPVTLRLVNHNGSVDTSYTKAQKIEKIVEQEIQETTPIPGNEKAYTPPPVKPLSIQETDTVTESGSGVKYFLQAGAFSEKKNAEKMLKNINIILSETPFKILLQDGLYKVISHPLPTREKAEYFKKILLDIDIDAFIKEL